LKRAEDKEDLYNGAKLAKKLNIHINPVKFRYSHNNCMFDKDTNTIFKGIVSIKGIGEKANIADQLLSFKDRHYTTFSSLLCDIKECTTIGLANIKILTELDFFSEFGDANRLLQIIDVFDCLYGRKQLSKDKLHEMNLTYDMVEKHAGKITDKLLKDLDIKGIIEEKISTLEYSKRTPVEILVKEHEYYSYMQSTFDISDDFVIVSDIDIKYTPKIKVYTLATGEEKTFKVYKSRFYAPQNYDKPDVEQLINMYDVVKINRFTEKQRQKKVSDNWLPIEGETDLILESFQVVYKYIAI
jgi:hypothetical protein